MLAVSEHRDAVRHGHRLGLVVRHVDHGDAELAMDALDLELHLLAQVLVERAERLVEQENVGIEDEAARERHALLLAARQLARVALRKCRQADEVEHAVGARLAISAAGSCRILSGNTTFFAAVMCGNNA